MSVYRRAAAREAEPVPPLLERVKARWVAWQRSRETPVERKHREMVEALERLAKTHEGTRVLIEAMRKGMTRADDV
jgi:hypothetical protein